MPVVFWNESLSVKIKTIDDQHKKLIEILNDFYDNIVSRTNIENTTRLINELREYTVYHFAQEENYMKQLNYDHYPSHKKSHEQFIIKIDEVEEKIKQGKTVMSLEMTMFLKDWIKNHIMVADKKYSDFFIKNGIK